MSLFFPNRSFLWNLRGALLRDCDFFLGIITNITRTRQYNFDPLKPHFYIVKLGFTGVYIFFLFLLKNIDCGYSYVF